MGTVSATSGRVRAGPFGRWLLLFGAVLGALTVFAALVPADLGVWPRFEPGGMALFLAAGICAVGLTCVWCDERPAVEAALGHPLVLSVMLVALATAVFAPFMDYPWLSIFGYPLIGEGVLRYGAMGMLFAAAIVLRGDPPRFRLLLIALLVGSIGGTVALFVWARADFVSLDIAGILAVSAWVGAWYLVPGKWGGWRFAICVAAVVPVLAVSTNDTAIVSVIVIGLPASALVYLNLKQRFVSVRISRTVAAAGLVAIPVAALLAVWLIPMLTDALPSITSRKFTYQVALAALRADPAILFAGQGWGEIVMTMDLFRTASDAILWDGSWDGATRDLPHSHNLVIEALFGGGIVAAIGLLAMLAFPVLVCREPDLPVAVFAVSVFAGIGAIWPQVAMTVGPVALALGLTCAPLTRPTPSGAIGTAAMPLWFVGRVSAWLLPVFASLLLGGGIWLVSQGLDFGRTVADVRDKGGESAHACDLLPLSAVYGDLDLAQGLVNAYRSEFAAAQKGRAITEAEHRLIAAFLCSAEARARQSVSPSLHLGLESFRGHVASDGGRTADIVRYRDSLSGWADKLVKLLNAAPTRTDMTLTFYAARSEAGAWETIGSMARALIHANPDDPMANWYLGHYLLSKGGPISGAAARTALKKSLNNGIKKIISVPPDTEAWVAGGRGSPASSPDIDR